MARHYPQTPGKDTPRTPEKTRPAPDRDPDDEARRDAPSMVERYRHDGGKTGYSDWAAL